MAVMGRPLKAASYTSQGRKKPRPGFQGSPATGTITSTLSGTSSSFSGSVTSPSSGFLETTFTLNSTSPGTKPFCIGHCFKEGDVPTSLGVTVTGASAQITPKNYWADGSLKFAIISGTYTQTTANNAVTITLNDGTSSTGEELTLADLQATGITASVNAGAFGSASWTNVNFGDASQVFQTWVSGHEMSSWIYRKQVGTDSHLVAWLEVRLWSTGDVEVLPWVENGYVDVASPTNKSATYTFTLGGTQRFSLAIDIPHHCRTPLLSGTAVSHWLGTDPAVSAKHNADYMMATELVPAYDAKTPASSTAITAQPASFTPFQLGSFEDGNAMGAGGYHNHIGILPEWDAAYLTAEAGIDLWKPIQWNGYTMGRFSIHYRDESTNRPILFASHATRNLSASGSYEQVGVQDYANNSETSTFCPTPGGTQPPGKWTYTHAPSAGFMAYLMTGRYWFLEEAQFAATVHFLRDNTSRRQQAKGIFRMRYGEQNNTTRGLAWQLRTLAQAACITPDADTTMRANFVDSLKENVNFYKTDTDPYRAVGLGCLQPDGNGYGSATDPYLWNATWQHHYVVASFGYIKALNFEFDATTAANLNTMFGYLAQSVTGLLGGAGATEYLYRDAGIYAVAHFKVNPPPFSTGAGGSTNWWSNWGEIHAATFSGSTIPDSSPQTGGSPYASLGPKTTGGDLRGSFLTEESGGEYGILNVALSYAVKHGATAATQGMRKIKNAPNYYQFRASMDTWPVNALAPRAVPKWRRGLALNTWVEIPNSAMNLTPPTVNPGGIFGPSSKMRTWCGLAIDTRTNKVWSLANGGHGDYYGNEVMYFDLNADEPTWVEHLASSASATPLELPRYADGRPAASHTYYAHQFLECHDRAMRVGAQAVAGGNSPSFWDVDGFNVTVASGVNGWDAQYTYPRIGNQGTGSAGTNGWATCKNPDTEEIYVFVGNTTAKKMTPGSGVGGTWSTVGSAPPSGYSGESAAAAYDTRRDKVFVIKGSLVYPYVGNTRYFTMTSAGTWAEVSVPSGAAKTVLDNAMTACGMVYVPELDAYYVRLGELGVNQAAVPNRVLKIDAATFAVSVLSVTGGATIPKTYDVNAGTNQVENVYNRWLYVPSLRGIVYFPDYTANAWFLRIF